MTSRRCARVIPHVHEASLFVESAFFNRSLVGQEPFFDSHEVDLWVLKAFCCVESHESDGIALGRVFVGGIVLCESNFLEKLREIR